MIKKLMFFLNIQRVDKFYQETFVEKILNKQKRKIDEFERTTTLAYKIYCVVLLLNYIFLIFNVTRLF